MLIYALAIIVKLNDYIEFEKPTTLIIQKRIKRLLLKKAHHQAKIKKLKTKIFKTEELKSLAYKKIEIYNSEIYSIDNKIIDYLEEINYNNK